MRYGINGNKAFDHIGRDRGGSYPVFGQFERLLRVFETGGQHLRRHIVVAENIVYLFCFANPIDTQVVDTVHIRGCAAGTAKPSQVTPAPASTARVPQTSDSFPIVPLAAVALLSLNGLIVLILRKREQKHK